MAPKLTLVLIEKTPSQKKRELYYTPEKDLQIAEKRNYWQFRSKNQDVEEFLTKIFLPAGYPKTVTPDYLQYQVLNAAQAFCNSLASLLASRAVLEGMGVGDPSASSTHAMLISVLQDAFGRITTIFGAYYLGTFLVPEAKLWRFLADVLNDLAVIIDTLSPIFSSLLFPGARVLGLCTSAALRALCGVVAGGSKASITMHFATPSTGSGDVGDLNAKDSSKETVLALMGMLLGGLIVPYVTSPWAVYPLLFVLIFLHLVLNYAAVHVLAIRNLNKQRATIAWLCYRADKEKLLFPQTVAKHELLFDPPGTLRDPITHCVIGECHIGSAPLDVMRGSALSIDFIEIFTADKYLVCFDPRTPLTERSTHDPKCRPSIHICFRDGYSSDDQLKGWLHAVEICRLISLQKIPDLSDPEAAQEALIKSTYKDITNLYSAFKKKLETDGWNLAEHYLMSGNGPKACLYGVAETSQRKISP